MSGLEADGTRGEQAQGPAYFGKAGGVGRASAACFKNIPPPDTLTSNEGIIRAANRIALTA
jgi:hypothetical protein